MADAKKTADKQPRKRAQTVRERSQTGEKVKPRRVQKTASSVGKPVKAVGRTIQTGMHPYRFMLRPFKTRPMRFIGRILAKILLVNYFVSSWKELRQVTWPGRKETWKLTLAVFVFAIGFGAVIALVDFGLDKLFQKLLLG